MSNDIFLLAIMHFIIYFSPYLFILFCIFYILHLNMYNIKFVFLIAVKICNYVFHTLLFLIVFRRCLINKNKRKKKRYNFRYLLFHCSPIFVIKSTLVKKIIIAFWKKFSSKKNLICI